MADASEDVRGALAGVMVAGLFGALWTLWGASGLYGLPSVIVRVVGILVGTGLMAGSIFLVRKVPGEGEPGAMFKDRRYRFITAAEVVAIILGSYLLGISGNGAYLCPWVAFVVGAHFLVFARVFWAGFAPLGAALVGAAVLGSILGVVTGDRAVIVATTALISAAALFVAGGRTLLTTSPQGHTA